MLVMLANLEFRMSFFLKVYSKMASKQSVNLLAILLFCSLNDARY